MSSQNIASITKPEIKGPVVNGVPTGQLLEVIGHIQQDAEMAQFQFRLENRWQGGGINRSRMYEWVAEGREQCHQRPFMLDADEPVLIAGEVTAPTPVEYVLHALVSCLTTTMIYHAAVQAHRHRVGRIAVQGDIDVRGFSACRTRCARASTRCAW